MSITGIYTLSAGETLTSCSEPQLAVTAANGGECEYKKERPLWGEQQSFLDEAFPSVGCHITGAVDNVFTERTTSRID